MGKAGIGVNFVSWRFIGDLSQSRWEQKRVQFGRNGSPVAAVLCVDTLDCSVREGPSALPCREAMCLYTAMLVSIYRGKVGGTKSSLDCMRDDELPPEASN
jgi:hypothetical protein